MSKTKPDEQTAEPIVCPRCGEDRFQMHFRGKVSSTGSTVHMSYDEVALQCLKCHIVKVVDVNPDIVSG